MTPTPKQLEGILSDSLWYEILFAFGIPEYDRRDYCQWEAVNFARIAHSRVLHAFLSNEGGGDDVLAKHYGFDKPKGGMPTWDNQTNKQLLHLTYSRAGYAGDSKMWKDEWISGIFDRCKEFMVWTKDHKHDMFVNDDFSYWKNLLEALESGRELGISARGCGQKARFRFRLGEMLPDGRPRLTRWVESTEDAVETYGTVREALTNTAATPVTLDTVPRWSPSPKPASEHFPEERFRHFTDPGT
jgi:hypothetical protein